MAGETQSTFTVLVTGANSGLGFAICCRIIDEFLATRPADQRLHLLYSTRDARKSADTLTRLNAHLSRSAAKKHSFKDGRPDAATAFAAAARIELEGVSVDLLRLGTIRDLAAKLIDRGTPLDAVIWNAGIANWHGVDWLKATYLFFTDLIHATTYPTYMLYDVGSLAAPQGQLTTTTGKNATKDEPPLGRIFTANVFGHYLLTHWLRPLFHARSRIVWVSSIGATPDSLLPDDLQGLRVDMSYEASKRLMDLLVLTADLPATQTSTEKFLPATGGAPVPASAASALSSATTNSDAATATPTRLRSGRLVNPAASTNDTSRPKMYVVHPGVVGTSIADLHPLLNWLMNLAFVLVRLLGSPWHGVYAYTGAASAVTAALDPEFPAEEERHGKGKWGSAVSRWGAERVGRTEAEGWGFSGKIGADGTEQEVIPENSVLTNRWRHMRATTRERREEFEVLGARAWREMEELREVWEERLGVKK